MDEEERKSINTVSPLKKLKTEILTEGGVTNNKFWWEENFEEKRDPKIKWTYLEHKGVYFPENYIRKNLKIKYNNLEINLDDYQEEIAIYWTETFGSEFHNNKFYKENFSKIFNLTFESKKEKLNLKKEEKINFDSFDFTNITKYLKKRKEKRKELSKAEKSEKKQKNQKINNLFKNAIVDNYLEKIGNFRIEPPSIFKGRGQHPQSGKIKTKFKPEDIALNLSKSAPVPKCHLKGRSWGSIISNKESGWLATCFEKVTNSRKYVALGASSKIKGLKDIEKYEKARLLKKKILEIRGDYKKKMKNVSIRERMLGTAAYIIDFLAIRAGNEKGENEADTVGCCNLRKEHVFFHKEKKNFVTFDFLGKDSMRYVKGVFVDCVAFENLKLFCEGKELKEQIFSEINSSKLNEYLNGLMKGLTAKVFRTYNASDTLEKELLKFGDLRKYDISKKIDFYQEANRKVAILCNHQKGITKSAEESFNNQNKKILELKKELKRLKKEDNKSKSFLKIKERLKKSEILLEQKEKNKGIALNTSKINYNDPRISVSWCKRNEVPIDKIFTAVLLEKFVWSMNVKTDWRF